MSNSSDTISDDRKAYLDEMVRKSKIAAAVFTQYSQADVDNIVKPMVIDGLNNAQYLAGLAISETRLGVLEDKTVKNMVATEFVYDYVKDKKTVGIIREYPENNVSEVAEPIGVIASLLPITNPTSTALFKCIMAVKTRNCMIFCAHPRAAKCSYEAAGIMAESAVKHGAPEGFISWVENPTLADSHYLMQHSDVRLVDATGGPSVVKAAYSSGKPALGVGAGNTPVYLEKTADIDMAVVDIITSKTFDNGTICASEQTVVIDDAIYDQVLEKFSELGAHVCNKKQTALLSKSVIDPKTKMMNPMAVGQKASTIAEVIGLKVPDDTKMLIAPIEGVGKDYPLSGEKLFPVLSVIRVHSSRQAIKLCMDVSHNGGLGHTAMIFSNNDDIIQKFGELINAGRLIVNSPGSIGALGGVYNDMVPTFSFGCGTGGGNSTIGNVNVYHYLNIKRMARRTQAHMWFKVPNQIFFNRNAVENLRAFPSRATVIVTNAALEHLGYVDILRNNMSPATHIHVQAIPDREPDAETIYEGVKQLEVFGADQIVALGGGSVIDAAKIMKLKYESPEVDLEELAAPFLDLRKRVVQYPTESEKQKHTRLIAISTTSGTGTEVTPFAVMSSNDRKISMVDYSLTPDAAIVDPQFVMTLPPTVTADTGIDCLTHALEAIVSIYASAYTDAMALQATTLVQKYLPIAYANPGDEDARSNMHNASCIAGIAFSNASVGVNHALAHAFGARFHISHGRANAIFIPHVIAYNAGVPTKFMPSPNTRAYCAHKKYALAADQLGLAGDTVADKVANLIVFVEGLLDQLDIPRSIAELGVDEDDFRDAMPELIKAAFDDPSWKSNPRMPLVTELEGLFWAAYSGRGSDKKVKRKGK